MNDDQMDELLVSGARDYNEPSVVPREEMWSRIAEARRERTSVSREEKPRVAARATWIGLALAAGVVLALGITIGRRLERTTPTKAPTVAANPSTTTPAPTTAKDSIIPQLREETQRTNQRVEALAANTPAGERPRAEPDLAYRLVMIRHIAGSEAMITAFRTSARRGEVDAQLATWSRELLSTTRLLEASPLTEDPAMKRLLEDLDLVLVQISQYVTRGTVNTEELDLIEQSINKRGVITKLRSTSPVRAAPTGT